MKVFAKILAVGLMTVAMTAFVACDSDDGGTTTDVIQDQGGPTDPGPTDPGPTDEGRPDTEPTDPGPTDPGPTDPGPTDPGQEDVPCVPNCGTQECGNDPVCDEPCGECDETEVCNLQNMCDLKCDWETDKPTSWSPSGVVNYLQTPASKTDAGAVCFDYTGEGTGDSALAGLAGQVNPPLVDAIEGGDIGIIFEFADVADFSNSGTFQLNGLLGASTAEPPVLGGEYDVSEDGYVTDTCKPLIYFLDAQITDGELTTPKSRFSLSIPLDATLVIEANLIDAQLKGTVVAGGVDGVELSDGVLSGVLTKEEITAVIDNLQASCDNAPEGEEPSYCGYLGMAKQLLPTLFDLHRTEDGEYFVKSTDKPANALSVCMTYTLAKATVRGFEAAAE